MLVSDTSVIVDLARGGPTRLAFGLPFEFAVPDLLYIREIEEYGGSELVQLVLRIEGLDGSGVALAITYRSRRPALSLPDSFALSLAKMHSWTLLTGDREL